ncbi:MAG: hypothetical protein ABJG33_00165 [Balneola sp.]
MTIDEKAEKYANETILDPNTYKGDVVTAYVCGACDNELRTDITLEIIGGDWCACFKIGNQKFRLAPSEDKGSATWMCTQLEKALKIE